jgi:hypothetical protein
MGCSTAPPTTASNETRELVVPVLLWRQVIRALRDKASGVRESGAFLLGERLGARTQVRSFVLYDELDPHVFESGIIRFASDGYSKLWKVCRERNQRAVADVHAHPGVWVDQSGSDQAYPMIPEEGHMALIVPNFARCRWWTFRGVGVHEYLGRGNWRKHTGSKETARLTAF